MRIYRTFGLAALLMLSFTPAKATTNYSSEAQMHTANPGLTFEIVNLSTLVGGPYTTFTDPFTGSVFNETGNQLQVTDSVTFKQAGSGPGTTITVTLPSNVVAFGAQMAGLSNTFVDVTFTGTFSGTGDSGSTVLPGGQSAYFGGGTSTGVISTVTYSVSIGQLSIADFEVGISSGSSSTPEAATLLYIGSGLLLLGLARKRLRWTRPAL